MDTKNDYTPKRRFPGFEGEWKQKEFGRMFQKLQTGTNLLGSEQGRGIPLLKMGNIQRGYWNLTKLERLDQEIERENIIKYGDFLFNTRNTLELVGKGATWFIQEGLYGFNSNLARVTFENVDTIFFNYLYNIPENIQQVKSRAVGTTSVAAIYPKDMVSIKFQLPTIDEQKKLGNFFQTIDSLISLHQHKLDKLKNLKKSYLAELFPAEGERVPKRRFPGFEGEWEEKEFGKMCQRIQTGTTLLGCEQGKGIPLLKMGNIQRGYWDFTKLERLNQEIECENIIKYGDFLFNTRNTLELVGKGATWFIKEGLYGFNSNLARVTLDDVDTIFFNYLYNIPEIIQQVKSRAVGTTSVAAIYPKDMSTIKFQLPTINEQNKLGNFFQTIDSLITLQQQKLDKLNDLKKAYLNELFV